VVVEKRDAPYRIGGPMSREKVISREYKIMFRADLFAGDEQQLLKAASNFWHEFEQVIDQIVIDTDGDLKKITNRRTIKFYDTDKHRLHSNNYIFRERRNDTGEREVTLKFRHPDRYISQDRNMEAGDADKGKTKFEEDIKPRFLTLYSFSTTQKIADTKNLNNMKDLARLCPDLSEKLDHYAEDEEIRMVAPFTPRELIITGARFQINKNPKLDSECALIVWYDDSANEEKPVVVEFSFRYGDKNESYTGNMAHRAHDVFQILQDKLASWIDPNSETKTAYVYR
jgi:hypothetical protein